MGKHINTNLEWDEVIPVVTAVYNFFQYTPGKERPFFLMFSQDPLTGLQKLLGDTTRYLGEGGGKLDLMALQNTNQLAAQNLQMAKGSSEVDEPSVPSVFQPGDLVTLWDQMAKAFDPKYKGEYRIIKMLGRTQVLLRNSKSEEEKHHVAHLKKTNPVKETVEKFGRVAKLWLNPDLVPDLKWEYKVTEVAAINDAENDIHHTGLQKIIKLLILHSCFRFICGTKGPKNLKNFIRYYRVIQCLHN